MQEFFDRIRLKSENPIPYRDAVQLLLWLYCVADIVPPEFKNVRMTREFLILGFAKLAQIGKIEGEKECANGSLGLHHSFHESKHWSAIIDALLTNQISLEDSFLKRIPVYL
jgi:hypothetical protein